jgi:hypothetical protein
LPSTIAAVEDGDGVAEADGGTDGLAELEAVGVVELAEAVDLPELKTPAIADAPTPTPTTRTATMMLTDHCCVRLAC